MEQQFQAKVIWLPSRNDKTIREKLNYCLGIKVINIEKISRIYDYYEENLNVLNCKLKSPVPLKEYKEKLIHRWCNKQNLDDDDEVWLSIKESNIFNTFNKLEDKEINIHSFSLGTMIGLNTLVEHYDSVQQNGNKSFKFKITQIKGDFEHDCKKISVYFIVAEKNLNAKEANADTHKLHKFQIEYSNIHKLLIKKIPSAKTMEVCFYLTYPLLLFMVHDEEKKKNEVTCKKNENSYINYYYKTPKTSFIRTPDFANCSRADIGLSNILKLELSWENSWDVICHLVNSCTKADCFFSPLKKMQRPKSYPFPQISGDNFNCIYALKCILSRTRDIPSQIYNQDNLKSVNNKLNKYVCQNPAALEMVLFEINSALERNNIVIFENALDFLYNKYRECADIINENSPNLVKVRRAILTPTRIIYLPPQFYFKCRFFRQFDAEYALRISVREDNYEYLNRSFPMRSECNRAIKLIKEDLLKGFKINGRHYNILGCSTSHLRDHGLMFYKYENIETILNKLGNFDHIKLVSKYMARMGQVFSQAIEAIKVDKSKVEEIDDIKGGSNEEYEFSDGIGKISPILASQAYEKLKILNEPSAIQIRYAGYKGMLTIWPDLKGERIIFRTSMNKFTSDSTSLEILKVSKPRLVYLNRHFVTILSQLGVPDDKFINLQKNMLERFLQSFIHEKTARDILKENCSFHINYDAIFKFGIEMLHEPFFVSLLRAIFVKHIELLKEKTRILIPLNMGRTMFGVLDETQTLEYGQVFIQYSKDIWNEEDRTLIIHKGDVLVTKNPCMHPGDVRKFQAVDIPDLRHIKDCIVFPAKGKRPHPNEMAGSDLDGDEYSVIWMDELLFHCQNHPPMDFPKKLGQELDHTVEAKDMVEFFCKYITESSLGILANAHLAWCDIETDGVFSEKCKKLARKYAISLDFAKTGENASLSEDERVYTYPDFFEKKLDKNTYRSSKILGQLYRYSKIVQLGFKEFIESDNDNSAYYYYLKDPDLDYPGSEYYIQSAKKAFKKYKVKIDSMLSQYGIRTEAELLSGHISKMHKYMNESQELNDLQLIEHRINMLIKEMREDFAREFLTPEDDTKIFFDNLYGSENKKKVFQKASAWYQITYDENDKRYFGLPWTITDVLNTMKEDQAKDKSNSRKEEFEKRLIQSLKEKFPDLSIGPFNSNNEVCEAIFNMMNQWIINEVLESSQLSEDYENPEKLKSEFLYYLFNEISDNLFKNEDGISFTKTLVLFLQRLSCLMMQRNYAIQSEYVVPYILNNQFVGQLAFKIFLNLVCSRNTDCFQSMNADLKVEEEETEATFRLSLHDIDLSERFCRFKDEVEELLMNWTKPKLKAISYRVVQERENIWIAIITVKGNKYSINHFQDLIIQSDFKTSIIDSIDVTDEI